MKLQFKLFIKERLKFTWCLQDCPWYTDNEDSQPGCRLTKLPLDYYDGWLANCWHEKHLKKIG